MPRCYGATPHRQVEKIAGLRQELVQVLQTDEIVLGARVGPHFVHHPFFELGPVSVEVDRAWLTRRSTHDENHPAPFEFAIHLVVREKKLKPVFFIIFLFYFIVY